MESLLKAISGMVPGALGRFVTEDFPGEIEPLLLSLALWIAGTGIQEPDPHEIASPLHPVSIVLTPIVKVEPAGSVVLHDHLPKGVLDNPLFPYCYRTLRERYTGTVVRNRSVSVSLRY